MKKAVFLSLGILALIASAVMYFVGKDSSHLSELYDVFWIPIPLGSMLIGLSFMMKNK